MLLRMVNTDLSLLKDPGFLVTGKKYRLGRSSKCAFVVNDLSVSRYHAELMVNDKSLLVKDLGSLNGTFIDGVRVTEADVRPGKTVAFGSAKFHLAIHQATVLATEDSDISTCAVNNAPSVPPPHEQLLGQLKEGPRRVLPLLVKGLSEKEVSVALRISHHTIHGYVKEIYRALKVHSRAELLALFVSESKFPE